jgi:AbrB family looped-hinge helix DNA binding protein
METITVKVSNRGYIVLPAPLRKSLELKPGSKMLLSREEDRLIFNARAFIYRKIVRTDKTVNRQDAGRCNCPY